MEDLQNNEDEIEFSFDAELIEKMKLSPFEHLINRLENVSARCKLRLEDIIDCMNDEITPIDKIRLLNADKNSVLFDLLYNESFETYKSATQKKPTQKEAPIEPKKNLIKSEFKEHKSITDLMKFIALPVFNSKISSDRAFYLSMTEEIDNKIAELILNLKTGIKKRKKTDNEKVSILSSPQLAILIELLYSNNIFINTKTDFLNCCEPLIGLKRDSINNDIWRGLKPRKSSFSNCQKVLEHIEKMKNDLEHYIEKFYPNS